MAEGLLDFIKTPEGQGLLATVFGGLAGARRGQPLNSLGRAGMAGVLGYGNALDRNAQASKDAQALELQKMQMDQLRKAATKSDQFDALASKFFTPGMPEQAGRPAIPGITPADSLLPPEFRIGSDATPTIPAKPPSFDMQGFANAAMGVDPVKGVSFMQAMQKDNAPINVAPGGTLVDKNTLKPVFIAPFAPKEPNPNQPFLLGPNGEFLPNIAYQDYEKSKARAGASSVSVNTGQKGLDNEMKFSAAFKGEPIYKAHQEVQSAHGQITQALNLKSPAGDLAGATKLMKILDPGSVVRESELAMAMAASGALDRLTNYGNMVITGQKLTPTQRTDFQKLADELSGESVKQYNAKRDEYSTFSKKYGLDSEVLLGKPAANSQTGKPAVIDKPQAQTFDAKPPAQQFKGKSMTGPDGKRYTSDGMIWKEVK
jgi:hypothetical protein